MKRNYFVIVAVIGVVLLSLNGSQGAQVQPFDLRKCQQELEVMKGILRTTLGFASQELASSFKSDKVETKTVPKRLVFGRGGEFNIGAFYLAGQGAVFTIPTSSVRDMMRAREGRLAFALAAEMKELGWNGAWMEQLGQQINELNAQLEDGFGFDGVAALAAVPAPPSPPAPAAPAVSASFSCTCPKTSATRAVEGQPGRSPRKTTPEQAFRTAREGKAAWRRGRSQASQIS